MAADHDCHDEEDDKPSLREEANGPGWREYFVDGPRASASQSVGEAVASSVSYVAISCFASDEECRALLDSAVQVQRSRHGQGDGDGDGHDDDVNVGSNHILFASGTNTNCDRYSVETLLDPGARAASAALLDRLLGFLDGSSDGHPGDHPPGFVPDGGGERMADLADAVFGSSGGVDAVEAGIGIGLALRDRQVAWYDEPDESGTLHPEPKVNVYGEGGSFAQHGDGMDLTLLVVLTDPTEFDGGGTAFYRDLDLSHDDLRGLLETADDDHMSNASHSLEPEVVARPDAGTAMIWGGTLQHRALPVTRGTRAVYVGSFNLN